MLAGSGDKAGIKALEDNLPTSGLAVFDFDDRRLERRGVPPRQARAVRQPEIVEAGVGGLTAGIQPRDRLNDQAGRRRCSNPFSCRSIWPTPIWRRPAIATAATLSQTWSGAVRLLNVLPMTPVMLAEYVPADFDTQQRQTSEEALAIVARESGIEPSRISYVVRQGGIYHEILEEAAASRPT